MGLIVILANLGAVIACGAAAHLWARVGDLPSGELRAGDGAQAAAERLEALAARLAAQSQAQARAAACTTLAMAAQAFAIVSIILAAALG
jgi:hypothetical protein